MEISVSSNIVNISGNIKSVNDFQDIKNTLDALKINERTITVNILDSISITSSIIGYFNKLVLKDKIDLHINIAKEQLLSLFDELHLSEEFKAKKI